MIDLIIRPTEFLETLFQSKFEDENSSELAKFGDQFKISIQTSNERLE